MDLNDDGTIRAHSLFLTPKSFTSNLNNAIYLTKDSEQPELTSFGHELIETVRDSAALIDLGCGKSMSDYRAVPELAHLAGTTYVGVDLLMSDYFESVAPSNGSTFPEWEVNNSSESYIQADMLSFLKQLAPPEQGHYCFYISRIEFALDERELNLQYVRRCLEEIKRLNGLIVLGFGISDYDFPHVVLEELGFTRTSVSEFDPKYFDTYPDLDPNYLNNPN